MSAPKPSGQRAYGDQIDVRYAGERVTVWNRVTVVQQHDVGPAGYETWTQITTGDGSTGQEPRYITPSVADWLSSLGASHSAAVLDPSSDEVARL